LSYRALIHGTNDMTVPIGGGKNFVGVPFPSADGTVGRGNCLLSSTFQLNVNVFLGIGDV
jgi:hypothetical protein